MWTSSLGKCGAQEGSDWYNSAESWNSISGDSLGEEREID